MNKLFIILLVVVLLVGCVRAPSIPDQKTSLTLTPEVNASLTPTSSATQPTIEPTTVIPAEVQSELDKLSASGVTGYAYRDSKIYTSESKIINVDSLGVITSPSEKGLSWWNSENKSWVVVDPINPETYPKVYLEHWNGLATRTPVSEATAEDIAFNDFQIETYRDFFPSIQSNLSQDPLWQAFFQANGSDFSAMTADQIYQASLLYGQTSKEVIMPIVLLEQQNQANPDNWRYTYKTDNHDGIISVMPDNQADPFINLLKGWGDWGFDQKIFGTIVHIDNVPIFQFKGIIQAQFRIPGVDPSVEIGLAVSFDGGKHLDMGVSFQNVVISPGDPVISYHDLDKKALITPSGEEQIFPALADQWGTVITQQELQELVGTPRTLYVGKYMSGNTNDIFSKNSGLQLVGSIFRTKTN